MQKKSKSKISKISKISKTRKSHRKGEFSRLYEKSILSFPISQRIVVDDTAEEKYNFIQNNFDKGVYAGKALWSDRKIDVGYAFFLVDKINKDSQKDGKFIYNLKLTVEIDKTRLPFEFTTNDLLPKIEVYMTSEFNTIIRFRKEDIIEVP